ncbi:MAG TPA: VOC family protein [Actinomycetota bacterium]
MAHGEIQHVELHTTDNAATQSFYEQVFGWTFDHSMGEFYLMFQDPSGRVGGGFSKEIPALGTVVFFVTVDSIEKTLAQAAELGGGVVQDKKLIDANVGSWASFKDPAGNVIGIFESAQKQ